VPPKKFALLAYYIFDVYETLLIIFDRNVSKEAGSQTILYFPTSPN